jgi:hypothetical protein
MVSDFLCSDCVLGDVLKDELEPCDSPVHAASPHASNVVALGQHGLQLKRDDHLAINVSHGERGRGIPRRGHARGEYAIPTGKK